MSDKVTMDTVEVLGAPEHHGVRADHRVVHEYVDNLLKRHYGNEAICKLIGCPPSTIEKRRKFLREKGELK